MSWTNEQLDAARRYEGTCTSIVTIAEDLDLSEDEAEELMLDANFELCPQCEWWCECGDLLDEETDDTGPCSSCRD